MRIDVEVMYKREADFRPPRPASVDTLSSSRASNALFASGGQLHAPSFYDEALAC